MSKLVFEVSWSALWKIFAFAVFCAVIYLAFEAFLVLLLAIVVSSAFDSPVSFLKDKLNIPRILGTIFIFAVGLFLIFSVFYILLPILFFEITSLIEFFTGLDIDFLGDNSKFFENFKEEFLFPDFNEIISYILRGSASIFGIIGRTLSVFGFAVSFLIISFYLTLSRDSIEKLLKSVFPAESEDNIVNIYYRARKRIGRWFQAQLILSFVVGLIVFVGLSIVGVKYSFLIAFLAAILGIVPHVGSIFSGLIGVMIALTMSVPLALWTLGVFLLVNLFESNFLVPLFMHKMINVHPVVVIMSLLIGYQVAGVIGMILSVPVAVVIIEIADAEVIIKKSRSK